MLLRRLLALLTLLGGVLGVAACFAVILAVWAAGSRLRHANEVVFGEIDQSLATVRERIAGAQQRTVALRITTEEVRQSLEDWTRQEAGQRLLSRLDVERKAERLGAGLQEADHYLELARTTLEKIQQAAKFGSSLGATIDATVIDNLHEQITSVRGQLKQAADAVDTIRDGVAQITSGERLPEQWSQIATLALRAIATLGEVDVRLGKVGDRLYAAQATSQRWESQSHRWIVMGQLGATLVIAWMAAGQFALCALGWRLSGAALRRGRETRARHGNPT